MPGKDLASKNKEIEAHIFNELYVNRNVDVIDEFIAENWVDHATETFSPEESPTRSGLKEMTRQQYRIFPDQRLTIDDMLAEGDKVVVRFSMTGTHTGEDLMGIPATGKVITVRNIVIDRFEDGKIIESWGLWDQLGIMKQLGLLDSLKLGK